MRIKAISSVLATVSASILFYFREFYSAASVALLPRETAIVVHKIHYGVLLL